MSTELKLQDALFLAKNSLREIQTLYWCKTSRSECTGDEDENELAPSEWIRDQGKLDLELDSPFSNVVNSVFPLNLLVSFNASGTSYQFLGRYAAFSLVLNGHLRGQYAIVESSACLPIDVDDHPEYQNKILVVLRGKCTFVKKIEYLATSGLSPRAIIVANNEPYRNLITMYSGSFNEDGHLTMPIMFVSYEAYGKLAEHKDEDVELVLATAPIDGWVNLMLLMAISPPILIFLCYLIIRGVQMCHRRQMNVRNLKLVLKLPPYIFHGNHLIPCVVFYDYLTITHQTDDIPLVPSSSEDLPAGQDLDLQPCSSSLVVNGVDLTKLPDLHLAFAPQNYYPTFKCSICLDKFRPLRSRVLVLECKHVFHEKCLSNWLINFRRSCPLCNATLHLFSALPLLHNVNSTASYGADLELGSQASDQGLSTTAVRNLLIGPARSESYHSIVTLQPSSRLDTITHHTNITATPPIASSSLHIPEAGLRTTRNHEPESTKSVESRRTYYSTNSSTRSSMYVTPQVSRELTSNSQTMLDSSTNTIELVPALEI